MSGRVVVLGSVNVDLLVETPRLPNPGETVLGTSLTRGHGGKGANQAVAAARAGAEVSLCGAVGNDSFGEDALEALAREGVNVERVTRVPKPTGTAVILVADGGENQIVIVPGANLCATCNGMDWHPGDVAMAVLEVPLDAVETFLTEARSGGARTILNPAPASKAAAELLHLADVVCLNEVELETLGLSPGELPAAGTVTVVTLGSRGIHLDDEKGSYDIPAYPVRVVDTVGAGDAVCGVLAAALADGRALRESTVRANAAAAMSVRMAGARTSPTRAELDGFLEQQARAGK